MTTYVSNRDGGKTDEQGHYRFHVKAWTGNVLSGLQAQAKNPLALGIDITVGDVKVDYAGYGYTAFTDALESVTLATADPSNPRIDRIVGYIDRDMTPSTVSSNNPGMLKFKAVTGTPGASPIAPTDSAVQSSVGASNPWFNIASVTVGTGVTTISSGNITDTRVFAGTTNQRALGQSSFIESGGVASFTAGTLNGSITGGVAWINFNGVLVTQAFNSLNFTMAASKDRYYYVTLGNSTIQATADVSNGASSPALPANSLWIAKSVSGTSAISSIKQAGIDSNGRFVYSTSPGSSTVDSFVNSGAGAGTFYYQVSPAGRKELWGRTGTFSVGAGGVVTVTVNLPSGLFTAVPAMAATTGPNGKQIAIHNGISTSSASVVVQSTDSVTANNQFVEVIIRGQ